MGRNIREVITIYPLTTARTDYEIPLNGEALWIGFSPEWWPLYDPQPLSGWGVPLVPTQVEKNYNDYTRNVGYPKIKFDDLIETNIPIYENTFIKRHYDRLYLTNELHSAGNLILINSSDPALILSQDFKRSNYFTFEMDFGVDNAFTVTDHVILNFKGGFFRNLQLFCSAEVIAGAPDSLVFDVVELCSKGTIMTTARILQTITLTQALPQVLSNILLLTTDRVQINVNAPGSVINADTLIRISGIYW